MTIRNQCRHMWTLLTNIAKITRVLCEEDCKVICNTFVTSSFYIIFISYCLNCVSITNWFKLYLSDRTQCVNIYCVLSNTHKNTFDVPQGSVLGPTLYCLYTKPVWQYSSFWLVVSFVCGWHSTLCYYRKRSCAWCHY